MKNGSKSLEVWGGIECTINRVGNRYFDQLEQAGHYDRNEDLERFAALGIKTLRYPVLWEKHQPKDGQLIDWNNTNKKLYQIASLGIDVIAGLVHHGSGPTYVNMLDDSFADGLAAYAGKVAAKFPWIKYYTPVNEPLTTARFCGLYGIWHPHKKSTGTFCQILINECKATVLAMKAIREINPGAMLVQTDDLGKTHSTNLLKYQADFENNRRWLSWDLLCGKVDQKHILWDHLISSGISIAELEFFIENKCPPDIIGINHYLTSERYLDQNTKAYPKHTRGGNAKHRYADVEAVRVGSMRPDGPYKLIKEAWERYEIPIVITEVHLHCTREEQMRWLSHVWSVAEQLRLEGVKIKAITAWALLGAFGWNKLLTEPQGQYEPGVFDLSTGQPRPTALAQMITAYNNKRKYHHPVLCENGWWQRKCRSIYGAEAYFTDELTCGKGSQIVILGYRDAAIVKTYAEICRKRAIPLILYDPSSTNITTLEATIETLSPSAVIDTLSVADIYNYGNFNFERSTGLPARAVLYKVCRDFGCQLLTLITDESTESLVESFYGVSFKLNPGFAHIEDSKRDEQLSNILVVKASFKPDNNQLAEQLDVTLDLLLDNETGFWKISEHGAQPFINNTNFSPGAAPAEYLIEDRDVLMVQA
jgi:dTDP-4-dehydrorhamnose reductase